MSSLDYQASIKEQVRTPPPGLLTLFGLLGGLALCAVMVIGGGANQQGVLIALGILGGIILLFMLGGIFVVNPNEAKVLVLFGKYVGSVRQPGMYWVNPFYKRSSVSLRIRNFESQKLKVNDHDGNPIEIAAIIVWKVVDSAEATFEVENYNDYVRVQSESALRTLATLHPYDAHQDGQLSLRANLTEVAEQLKIEIQERVAKAGVNISEARISHLAYSPEIAAAMLRRQQASAIIAARTKIVEGAVSMVEMALKEMVDRNIVQMDPERKATLVTNLMVVLCSEHNTQPVLNMAQQKP